MFKLISDAYAQTAQTATDVANRVTEVANTNWEYAAYAALTAGAIFIAYKIWQRQ